MRISKTLSSAAMGAFLAATALAAQDRTRFEPMDVFELEWAADPRISPDGARIAYTRMSMDIMADRSRGSIWILDADGRRHRPLTDSGVNASSPRWSPDGTRLAFVSSDEHGAAQIFVRWMDSGQTAKLTHVARGPRSLSWSPDGNWLLFSMFVPKPSKPFVSLPPKPEGAKWMDPPKVIDDMPYRADGGGYLEDGSTHLFLLPAEGGTPRQLTRGDYNHGGGGSWAPDSKSFLFSANLHDNWREQANNSEIYEYKLADGSISALTDRFGPDGSPALSSDGSKIAYIGFDDHFQGYQTRNLYVMNRDGSGARQLATGLDRSLGSPEWSADGQGIYVDYDDRGNTKIAMVGMDGAVRKLADDEGGLSLGRPYSGGSFSVAPNGDIAYTQTRPDHPSDVAIVRNARVNRLTRLNDDLLEHRDLARVEEIRFDSSFDDRPIQGWIAYPPGFSADRKYPLMLEIHGGPFADYGDRFAAEIQLYAAAGYVVLYANPRGSTSYGGEFGNLIHHAYPSQDFDDLMSGVDAVIAKGFVDEDNLFVTGGSGGGVLTAWIVGHTDRFRAAVSVKPVINWYSFVLTADSGQFFYKYWFPGFPWDHERNYMDRSPLAYAGKVKTPTMLMTGEVDYRTPSSEAEQFYQALKLRGVDTVLVRVPGASHNIARRPSQLIAKVLHVLEWFQRHRSDGSSPENVPSSR